LIFVDFYVITIDFTVRAGFDKSRHCKKFFDAIKIWTPFDMTDATLSLEINISSLVFFAPHTIVHIFQNILIDSHLQHLNIYSIVEDQWRKGSTLKKNIHPLVCHLVRSTHTTSVNNRYLLP
jgi:hypothetical protein